MTETKKQEYFEFKDLGIKIPKEIGMEDWSFESTEDGPNSQYVYSAEFSKLIDDCRKTDPSNSYHIGPTDKSFAAFSKVNGKYDPNDGPSSLTRLTKQFDDFYLATSYPNGMGHCYNTSYPKPIGKSPPGATELLENALKKSEIL